MKTRARVVGSRRYSPQPWNDTDVPLALYVSPTLKAQFDLPCRTTDELLTPEQRKKYARRRELTFFKRNLS